MMYDGSWFVSLGSIMYVYHLVDVLEPVTQHGQLLQLYAMPQTLDFVVLNDG